MKLLVDKKAVAEELNHIAAFMELAFSGRLRKTVATCSTIVTSSVSKLGAI